MADSNLGFTFIPNQPIIFTGEGDDCRGILDTGYCQKGSRDFVWEFQMKRVPCGDNLACNSDVPNLDSDIVLNGNFASGADWTAGTGWAIGAGVAAHTPGNTDPLYQTNPALIAGATYQCTYTITGCTAGGVYIQLGDGAGASQGTQRTADGTYTENLLFNDPLDSDIMFVPDTDFDGNVDVVIVQRIFYCYLDTGWIADPATGYYTHIPGYNVALLAVTTPLVAGTWYLIEISVQNMTTGQVRIVAGSNSSEYLTSNGTHIRSVYSGSVDQLGLEPDSAFDGQAKIVSVYELSEPSSIDLVDADDTTIIIADLMGYHTLDGDRINVKFSLSQLIADTAIPGNVTLPVCYKIAVDSICAPVGSNLITNGNFSAGSSGWTSGAGCTYDFAGNELEMEFDPISGIDYITNGDFATGDFTSWTAGAGWSVVGNKARHTPGSTATLEQTVTVPAYIPPPIPVSFWIEFVVSNHTAGRFTLTLGNKTSVAYGENASMMTQLRPTVGGAILFAITPTSDFDGDIDDIKIHYSNGYEFAGGQIANPINPLIAAGNYRIAFEIVSISDPRLVIAVRILGQSQALQYFNTPGTHTVDIDNYIPGAQQFYLYAGFGITYPIIGTVVVDNITLRPQTSENLPKTSNCITIMSDEDLECYKTLEASSACFNHGFDFRNFTLRLMVPFLRFGANYPQSSNTYVHSDGTNERTQSERDKVWPAKIDKVDEITHDAISVMLLQDEFSVDGDLFFFKGKQYTVIHDKSGRYNLARASFEVSKVDSVVFGNKCGSCSPLNIPVECFEVCQLYTGAVGDQGTTAGWFYEPAANEIKYWTGVAFTTTETCSGYIQAIDSSAQLIFNDVLMLWQPFIEITTLVVSSPDVDLTGVIPVGCAAQIQTSIDGGGSWQAASGMYTFEQIQAGVTFEEPDDPFWVILMVRCGTCIYYSPINSDNG